MTHEITPEQIEALVARAQKGHEESFEKIFQHFFDRIWRYVRFRVDVAEIEDVVGEVFLKVVEGLGKYRFQEGASFQAWIFRIAHNSVVDHYRKKKELLASDLSDDTEPYFMILEDENPLPDALTNQLFEVKKLEKLMQDMNPAYREMLELRYLEGLSNTEIAMVLGKTEGNVRVTALRALQKLREKWEGG